MKRNSITKLLTSSILLTIMLSSCVTTRKSITKTPASHESDLKKIIYYASLAGNSHNTQPWKVEVTEKTNEILIKPDFSRHLKVVDPTSRGLYISLGAFVENLCQASVFYGYSPVTEICKDHTSGHLFVNVKLQKSNSSKGNISSIEKRMTLRIPYKNAEIKPEHIDALLDGTDNCVSYISPSMPQFNYISQKTLESYSQQSNRDDAKKELAEWIRFSNKLVKENKDGLTTAGMGITGFAGVMVSQMFKPEDSMKDSFVNKGIDNVRKQVQNCGGWLLITQDQDSPENWIKTGRIYQRINLRCRDLMIGMHPMNQMIEEASFEGDANRYLISNGKIQFIARIGYVDKYPEPVSVRRELKDFVLAK
ncbi:MAG: hypothetical protein A2X19_02130 [Bacteroidetes bacterium GWE2_39_28]|nr:MAG: hypothetical protein A2X19_02130 [Bacteroidetes bacterium GWE2_39_28]OFY12029.1 MAG: hypothetical protein A2X16_05760 [Bacteroidetes bacterium GWF2_39_10]OFZ07121.1 MAG: hypothetical protein A2322_02330 [Bacteroidetes bacterium RIFOXYB2_FULL_39_7]OFZ11284.1 MAG: hypothetical protein A2465_09110 [Bacteroidetes bacterium RIFOXYC2_FULL_39_11]HCT95133.1 nitroreductase [Rikenellaceae bacterium]